MTAAILFDCDGVLVDTEVPANEAMAAFFTKLGLRLSGPECRRRFQGLSSKAIAEQVTEETGMDLDPAALDALILSALSRGVSEIPGASALVQAARARGLPICVASSGSIEKMRMTLGQTGLLGLFEERLYSTALVARGKPFPDIFLHAAAQLGVDITHSVIIEDSLSGMRAGVASGARVLGLCADDFADPDAARTSGAEPVPSLDAVAEVLGLRP